MFMRMVLTNASTRASIHTKEARLVCISSYARLDTHFTVLLQLEIIRNRSAVSFSIRVFGRIWKTCSDRFLIRFSQPLYNQTFSPVLLSQHRRFFLTSDFNTVLVREECLKNGLQKTERWKRLYLFHLSYKQSWHCCNQGGN